MKIDKELTKKLLVVGAMVLFVGLFLLYSDDEDVSVFVNGDEVSKTTLSIGSIASTADTYEFAPGETMILTMAVTNNQNQEYDFSVTVWEEISIGSQDIEVFKSVPITLDEGQSHTFTTDIIVPFEPGTYFYSTVSYYSPVGFFEYSMYNSGTYFSVTVLDITPVSTPTPEGTPVATPTPDIDDTTPPGVTGTPGITGTPSIDDGDEDSPFNTILDGIDLEDEDTKIVLAAIAFGAIMAIGLTVINKRRKK